MDNKNSVFSGGDGLTKENPVVINLKNNFAGVIAEYQYIASIHGDIRENVASVEQTLLETETGHMDQLNITLKDGTQVIYYFDITNFFGKY